jgi:L-alanine-DL-glutamate epimerase-like enolase superfamily enzyme
VIVTDVDLSIEGLLAAAPPLERVDLRDIVLRKKDPTWRFALAANPANPGFLAQLVARDGTTGSGSAGEIGHIGHHLRSMRSALADAVPVLVASAGSAPPARSALSALTTLNGPARAIVQTALLDLVARHRGQPAHELLGPVQRRSVELTRIVPLKSPGEMAEAAAELVAEGYRNLKIKLDNSDADLDVARVAAIRQAVGPAVGFTIDANQSYPVDGAVEVARRLEPYRIDVFEQPNPADDIAGLAEIRRRSPIPIEADESAASLERIASVVNAKAADGVSIKIPKLGGIDHALSAIRMCGQAGLHVRMGAHVGSQLLNAAAVHLAAVVPDLAQPSELAEFDRLLDDPVTGLTITNGRLDIPPGAGYGVAVTGAPSEGISQ